MKNISLLALILATSALLAVSCSKKNARDAQPVENTPKPTELDNEKYLREGFIADDLFRVVIVDCGSDCAGETIENPRDKAEKRALASLQKYLLDRNGVYDNNTRAGLLDLIQTNGTFSKQDIIHKNNSVYYLDLRKQNIRKYVDGMARPR
jgi:hypothetical protein